MAGWISFWTYACLVFFAAFYLLLIVVVPLGGRDLVRLFRHLSQGGAAPADEEGQDLSERGDGDEHLTSP